MLKLVFCLRRLPGLSREEFQRYWREVHGPLVRRHAEALRVSRYVQVHTRGSDLQEALRAGRGGPEAYDGVAELWWPDAETLAAAMQTPEGRLAGAELLADEKRFIDLSRSPLFVADEREIVPGAQKSGSSSGA